MDRLNSSLRCHVAMRLGGEADVPDELAETEIGGNEIQNDDAGHFSDPGENAHAERHAP